MATPVDKNDLVKLSFEGEFGNQSPIKGRVKEVDENPEVPESAELVIVVRDEKGSRDVVFTEGIEKAERWTSVHVKNKPITLGRDADWEKL